MSLPAAHLFQGVCPPCFVAHNGSWPWPIEQQTNESRYSLRTVLAVGSSPIVSLVYLVLLGKLLFMVVGRSVLKDIGQLPLAASVICALMPGAVRSFEVMAVGADRMLIGRFRSRGRRMLGGCLRRYPPRPGRPSTFRTRLATVTAPLVWQLRPRRQCIELPGEEARLSRDWLIGKFNPRSGLSNCEL